MMILYAAQHKMTYLDPTVWSFDWYKLYCYTLYPTQYILTFILETHRAMANNRTPVSNVPMPRN